MPSGARDDRHFSQGDVSVDVDEHGVAVVEMHRPPSNFFDTALIGALADVAEALGTDGHSRVIVVCAEGKHFCAGANFSSSSAEAPATNFAIPTLYREGARLFRAPLPMVAAVHGAAIGGGLGLACAADFRVACAEARFSANFARLGFHQGFALSVSLPRIVGQQAALDLLYTGRRVSGEEAFALGLCDRLVDAADVRASAYELAREIARSGPLAVQSIRATMRRELCDALDDALAREAAEQERLRATSDFAEGVRASAQRREPNFEGR